MYAAILNTVSGGTQHDTLSSWSRTAGTSVVPKRHLKLEQLAAAWGGSVQRIWTSGMMYAISRRNIQFYVMTKLFAY